jgi:hypothetical protein
MSRAAATGSLSEERRSASRARFEPRSTATWRMAKPISPTPPRRPFRRLSPMPSPPFAASTISACSRWRSSPSPSPRSTTSGGYHYLAPDDIAAIYDLTPIYKAGITGAGQRIAIVGETNINLSDIRAYRKVLRPLAKRPAGDFVRFGLGHQRCHGRKPTSISNGPARSPATRPSCTSISPDVFTAAEYAIDQNLAPVLSMSWGACELYANAGFEVGRPTGQCAGHHVDGVFGRYGRNHLRSSPLPLRKRPRASRSTFRPTFRR